MKKNAIKTENANLEEMESRKLSDDDLDNVTGGFKVDGGGMRAPKRGGEE